MNSQFTSAIHLRRSDESLICFPVSADVQPHLKGIKAKTVVKKPKPIKRVGKSGSEYDVRIPDMTSEYRI
jgi:hypothetical protein